MKIIFRFLLILYTGLFFATCSEDFNPFKEAESKYILNCILRSDTTYQTVYLSKSYFANSQYENEIDPSITGADVRVWYNDSVYLFRDTSVARTDTLYNSDFKFYYSDRFKVAKNKPVEIEVLLSNGKRLKSQSVTPDEIEYSESEVLVPSLTQDYIRINWKNKNDGTFYSYKLSMKYSRNVNGVVERFTKELPINYVMENGSKKAVYPEPTTKPFAIYQLSAITESLHEISNGSEIKSNYAVNEGLVFELFAYDKNVSKYISSTSHAFDNLTIRVNELDFTNIEGGLGIFGSFMNKNYNALRFQRSYIESFGYHFIQN